MKSAVYLKHAYVAFAAGTILIGLLTTEAAPGHFLLGPQDSGPLAIPSPGTSINKLTGFLLIIWGWACLAIFSYGRVSFVSAIVSPAVASLIAAFSLIVADLCPAAVAVMQRSDLFSAPRSSRLTELLVCHLVFATIGSCVRTMEHDASERWTGFRIGKSVEHRKVANLYGGLALHLLSCLAILMAVALDAIDRGRLAYQVAQAMMMLNPIAAAVIGFLAQRFKPQHYRIGPPAEG